MDYSSIIREENMRATPTLVGIAHIEAQLHKTMNRSTDPQVLEDSVETLREVLKAWIAKEFPGMEEMLWEQYEDLLSTYPPEALV
jgi:hypothetical protein